MVYRYMSVNIYFMLTLLRQPEYECYIVFLNVSSEMAFLPGSVDLFLLALLRL
jgi:hypothetical protein